MNDKYSKEIHRIIISSFALFFKIDECKCVIVFTLPATRTINDDTSTVVWDINVATCQMLIEGAQVVLFQLPTSKYATRLKGNYISCLISIH